MATRKQRRRREKSFRHEYEFVERDEEGNEIPVERVARERAEKKEAKPARSGAKRPEQGRNATRPVREVRRADLERALQARRADGRRDVRPVRLRPAQRLAEQSGIVTAVIYAVLFIPMTYWADRLAYRTYLRRSGAGRATSRSAGTRRAAPLNSPRMPLVVDTFVLGPFQSNCYVVRAERGAAEAAVIDPGGDPTHAAARARADGHAAGGILVTHSDVDHIGGVAALAEGTGAEVWAPAGEVEALRSGETRGGMQVPPHDPAHAVAGGDEIDGRRASRSRSSTSRATRPATSRSTATASSSPATCSSPARSAASTSPGGDWETLLESVARLLERYRRDAVVYPGHGAATTLGRELETNPFLSELRAEQRGA